MPKPKQLISKNTIIGCYDAYDKPVDLYDSSCNYVQISLIGSHANANDMSNNYMLISKEHLNNVLEYNWYLSKDNYPMTHGEVGGRSWSAGWKIHNFLHKDKQMKNLVVDHINRNRLDNRKENLRICTAKENSYNTSKRKNKNGSSSKYKGVSAQKSKNGIIKWTATVTKDGVTTKIKNIESEIEAAKMYDLMAEELFGEFAGKNFDNLY